MVGISHGLVCFYCPDTMVTIIWNPPIRKSIEVVVPNTPYVGRAIVGFGVCPVTTDPKIVAVKQSWDRSNMETSYQCEVMVYSLSSGEWRSLSTNLPTKPIKYWWKVASVDRFIYWLGGFPGHNMIISFDVTNESFEMIDLPDSLARHGPLDLHMYELRESLAIVEYLRRRKYTVWMMEGDVQRSFTKLFTVHAQASFSSVLLGLRKSGVPILRVENDGQIKLGVYENNSEHSDVLQVSGYPLGFTVNSYTETLLLLGRSDCSSY